MTKRATRAEAALITRHWREALAFILMEDGVGVILLIATVMAKGARKYITLLPVISSLPVISRPFEKLITNQLH